MVLTLRIVLGLMLVCAACGSVLADEKPPVFTDKKLDEVLTASKGTAKIVVVKATASWCAPCKAMDKTTWRDEGVVKWFKENGTAVQFDVDADTDLAKRYAIRAMPTMIAFKDGVEFDRIVGGKQAPEFLAWLEGVKRGEKAGDGLAKKREAGKMTGQERLQFAQDLTDDGKYADALKEYEWLWKNLLKEEPAMVGVRASFMAKDMTRLSDEYAPAKVLFGELRDEIEGRPEGVPKSLELLRDWMVLNDVTREQDRTLAWFDRVKGDPEWVPILRRLSFKLKKLLLDRNRYVDLAVFFDDPVKEVEDCVQKRKASLEMQSKMKFNDAPPDFDAKMRDAAHEDFRTDTGHVYAAMLSGKRPADAMRAADAAIKADDTPAMRASLVEWAIKAGVAGAEQRKLLDEAEAKGADVKKLRDELNRLSGVD